MSKIEILSDYEKFKEVFTEENAKLNLISKNDESLLYEKHFYDSLAIKLFFKEYNFIPKTLLDIGTGGGFPSVPIAMEYPQIQVTAIDSIRKKISAVNNIKEKLDLKNLNLVNDRVENIDNIKFDVITSRAVGKIDILIKYAYPLLNDGGYIILYKSKTASEELNNAKKYIRSYQLKILPQIDYSLPLETNYSRNLIIFNK